jgi:creatinine amidohydrolase
MFRDELEDSFKACPLVYFPYGLCEPHGPGITLGIDALNAHGTATAAARAHGGIVAPPWYWHIAEMGGDGIWCRDTIGEVERSWFTSFPPWMFFKSACYHIRTAEHMGFHAAIFFTGHAGLLVDDFRRMLELIQPFVGTRLSFQTVWDTNPEGFGDGLPEDGHAGKVEMSRLWALEPDCVDFSRLPPAKTGHDFAMAADAIKSNRKVGEQMVARSVKSLGELTASLLEEYDRVKPEHTFIRFEQVEAFWDEKIRPVFKTFGSMQEKYWDYQQPIEPGSVWYPNWLPPDRSG